MKIHQQIRQYIIQASLSNEESIQDDTLIFEQGLLDSMGLLFLVQFLSDEFKVNTADDELDRDNFESINAIVSYVTRKLAANEVPTSIV